MTDQHIDFMQRALSTRLCMQISLSALPAVKEWMDSNLTRWLESVPLPPELPSGTRAEFRVSIASDLSRLTWSAYGPPRGFVPKMSRYLEKCGVGGADTALLNAMGEKLEPEAVGSWIRVAADKVYTGWQFCEEQDLARLVPQLGTQASTTQLLAWIAGQSVAKFRRFGQAIGDDPISEIELVLPGESIADQVAAAANAVASLLGKTLPDCVGAAMNECGKADLAAVAYIAEDGIRGVGLRSPGLPMDTISKLCADAGAAYDNKLAQLEGALQAEGIAGLEFRLHAASAAPELDVIFIPGASGKVPDLGRN